MENRIFSTREKLCQVKLTIQGQPPIFIYGKTQEEVVSDVECLFRQSGNTESFCEKSKNGNAPKKRKPWGFYSRNRNKEADKIETPASV